MNPNNPRKDDSTPSPRNPDSPVPSTSNEEDTPASPDRTRRLLESVVQANRDQGNDNHSSEEELEDINSRMSDPNAPCGESRRGLMSLNLRSDSVGDNSASGLPEKRRWSDLSTTRTRRSYKMNRISRFSGRGSDPCSESSDEEIQGLLANIENSAETTEQASTEDANAAGASSTPPTNAENEEEKNERSGSSQAQASGQAHVQVAQHLLQRPCLDFEKMQQNSYSSGNLDYVEDEEQESP